MDTTILGAGDGSIAVTQGAQVAVKKVRKEEGVCMTLLRNEIIIWRQLNHPNLIRLLDVFETDDMLYLVTELMRGGDLFQHLAKASTFSEVEAARLARQIIGAVSHLHDHGVVHCDLKPSNILVLEREADRDAMTVKIADFGLSQSLAQQGQLTDVCGTPDYFAPELAEIAMNHSATWSSAEAAEANRELKDDSLIDGKGYGSPLDCWAVGCIVYELLAGHPPYQAQDEAVLFYKITENQMEFPKAVFESISPDAISLIKDFTATDAESRLSCADALKSHPWLVVGAELTATPLPEATKVNRRQSVSNRRESLAQGGKAITKAVAAAATAEEAIPEAADESQVQP